jgi:DNA-binding PadR family transcriptional regulator
LEKLVRGEYVTKERVLTPGGAETRYRLTPYGHQTFREYVEFLGKLLETDR